MNEYFLTSIEKTGQLYVNVFEDKDGNIVIEKTTEEEYNSNTFFPEKEGHKWLYSYSDFSYNTTDGFLPEGGYFIDKENCIAKINGEIVVTNKSNFIENKLTIDTADTMSITSDIWQ